MPGADSKADMTTNSQSSVALPVALLGRSPTGPLVSTPALLGRSPVMLGRIARAHDLSHPTPEEEKVQSMEEQEEKPPQKFPMTSWATRTRTR